MKMCGFRFVFTYEESHFDNLAVLLSTPAHLHSLESFGFSDGILEPGALEDLRRS